MIYSVPADAANNNYKVELLGRDVGGTGDFTRWTDLEAGRIDARDTLVAQSNARVGNPNTTLTNNGDLTVAGDARLEGALELPNGNQGSSESTRFLQMGPATVGGFDIASSISVQSFQGPRSNMITNRPNVTFGTSNQNPVLEFVQFVPDDPSTENYLVRFAGTDGSGDFDQLADFLIGRTTIGRPNTELTGAGDLTVAGDLRVEGSNNITSSDGNFDTLTVGNPNTDLTANGTLTTAGDVRIEGNWTVDQGDRQAEFVPAGSFEGFDWEFTSNNTTGTKRIRFNPEFDTLALDDWQLRVGVSGPTANTNGLAVESNAVIGNPNTQLNNAGDLTVAGDLRVEGSNNITSSDGQFDTLTVGNPNTDLTGSGDLTVAGNLRVEGQIQQDTNLGLLNLNRLLLFQQYADIEVTGQGGITDPTITITNNTSSRYNILAEVEQDDDIRIGVRDSSNNFVSNELVYFTYKDQGTTSEWNDGDPVPAFEGPLNNPFEITTSFTRPGDGETWFGRIHFTDIGSIANLQLLTPGNPSLI